MYDDESRTLAKVQVGGRRDANVGVYGMVSKPSKSPPIRIMRFCGGEAVGFGVCSNAVSFDVYTAYYQQRSLQ